MTTLTQPGEDAFETGGYNMMTANTTCRAGSVTFAAMPRIFSSTSLSSTSDGPRALQHRKRHQAQGRL